MQRVDTLDELAILLQTDLSRYDIDSLMAHPGLRLDGAFTQVVRAIKGGGRPAAILACRLMMEDPHLPFGKLIKSNLARALKQQVDLLTEHEKLDLAGKTAALLSLPYCPREVEDYCRLVKKMGGRFADTAVAMSRPIDEKAHSLVAYLGMPPQKAI